MVTTIEWDPTNEVVGPRVLVWGDVDSGEVDAACPEGWEVDQRRGPQKGRPRNPPA